MIREKIDLSLLCFLNVDWFRYVLLLRDLLKHMPSTHPDYGQISDAYDQFTEKAAMLNEKKREAEVIHFEFN